MEIAIALAPTLLLARQLLRLATGRSDWSGSVTRDSASSSWIVTNEGSVWFTQAKDHHTLYAILDDAEGTPGWKRGTAREIVLKTVRASALTTVSVFGQNDRCSCTLCSRSTGDRDAGGSRSRYPQSCSVERCDQARLDAIRPGSMQLGRLDAIRPGSPRHGARSLIDCRYEPQAMGDV